MDKVKSNQDRIYSIHETANLLGFNINSLGLNSLLISSHVNTQAMSSLRRIICEHESSGKYGALKVALPELAEQAKNIKSGLNLAMEKCSPEESLCVFYSREYLDHLNEYILHLNMQCETARSIEEMALEMSEKILKINDLMQKYKDLSENVLDKTEVLNELAKKAFKAISQ